MKDFIKDIIDTNVVIPVLGTGTADSPLEMEVQNVTIEKYDEFISKLEGLDPILVEKYEDSEAIFYKIKVKDKSIISKLTNIFRTSTSDEGHIILKIAKNLDNSDYLLAKLDHILASKDNSGDITTPGEDNSDESNNSNEDIKDSQNSNINKLPITGKESILAYLSLISIAIGTVLYKKRK